MLKHAPLRFWYEEDRLFTFPGRIFRKVGAALEVWEKTISSLFRARWGHEVGRDPALPACSGLGFGKLPNGDFWWKARDEHGTSRSFQHVRVLKPEKRKETCQSPCAGMMMG